MNNCNPNNCGKFIKEKNKKALCLTVFEECKKHSDEKYTKQDVNSRASDLICFPCGSNFLTKKQKIGTHVVITHVSKCGLCGKKTNVTHIKHFNNLYLADDNN